MKKRILTLFVVLCAALLLCACTVTGNPIPEGMDEANRRNITRMCGGDPEGKISLLLDHTPNPREVADPWYTGNFERTWLDVSEGCAALLAEIRKKEGF